MSPLPSARQLKNLWEVISVIRNGKSCEQNKDNKWSKITRIETISDWTIDESKVWYFDINIVDKEKFSIRKWDILFSHINSPVHIGKVAIAKKNYDDLFHWMNLLLIRGDETKIDYFYLYNILNYFFRKWDWEKICKKAINQASLNQGNIAGKEIPLPPLPTQHAIVARLDEASATINSAKSAIQDQIDALDVLWQSSLSKVFDNHDHEIKKLSELCEITSSKRIYEHEYVKEWIQFFRWKEIILKSKWKPIKDPFYISLERYNEIKDKFGVPQKWDLLLTSVGTLGIPYIIQEWEVFYFKDGNLTRFRKFEDNVFNRYLVYWFYSANCRKQINATLIGSAQKALTIVNLNKFQLPLPPLSEQQSIVSHLDELHQIITHLKAAYTSQLTEYDAMWASILDKAFRGELVS